MVGVNMRVDHVADAHSRGVGGFAVGGEITDRVDHGCSGASAAAKQVRGGNRIGLKKLAQDHSFASSSLLPNQGKLKRPKALTRGSTIFNYSLE